MTTETPTVAARTTASRWLQLARELDEIARRSLDAEAIDDDTRERVGQLVVREAVALRASTAWPSSVPLQRFEAPCGRKSL